ncbi:LOW QUALITY PROTEIN: hypothetical protein BC936DRAFT_148311 [Jimgerdemannia flammicorona]|uniref:Uncharacterized protein n=1 Tax=Jimgerdemannia flammicorona TaxID=994334 RepID=A0A433D396_9FUNG|nr:LOW QUALITY PROTEIN: hypothetical protein BC936DRAFT_148311 [Jimgerdemannia flammicorona]
MGAVPKCSILLSDKLWGVPFPPGVMGSVPTSGDTFIILSESFSICTRIDLSFFLKNDSFVSIVKRKTEVDALEILDAVRTKEAASIADQYNTERFQKKICRKDIMDAGDVDTDERSTELYFGRAKASTLNTFKDDHPEGDLEPSYSQQSKRIDDSLNVEDDPQKRNIDSLYDSDSWIDEDDLQTSRQQKRTSKALDAVKPPSWEFSEPMPGWLAKAKIMNEKLKSQTNAEARYKSALRPIWWQIIDISDDSFIQQLSDEESEDFNSVFASSLNVNSKDSWKVLAPAAERCLTSLSKLNEEQLRKIGEMLEIKGIDGGIREMRKMLSEPANMDQCETDLDLFGDRDETAHSATYEATRSVEIIEELDGEDWSVRYILNLLRYICEMITKQIPQRKNTERDIDIFIKVHIFACLDQVLDRHFGEMVSRASRARRSHALGLDNAENAEGHRIDWMFTKPDLEKNLPWGLEFSLCERAGSTVTSDTIKVQKNLRDMHASLVEHIKTVGCGLTQPVLRASTKLVMPGFLSTSFQLRVLLLVYVGGNFYASMELARVDIPTTHKELKGIVNIGRVMLQVTNILRTNAHRFNQMKQRAEKDKLSAQKITFKRNEEERTPKKPKNHRKASLTHSTCGYMVDFKTAPPKFLLSALLAEDEDEC